MMEDIIIQLASYIQVGLSGTENKLILLHGYHGSQLASYPGPFFAFFFSLFFFFFFFFLYEVRKSIF